MAVVRAMASTTLNKAGIPPGKSDASGGIGPKTLMLK